MQLRKNRPRKQQYKKEIKFIKDYASKIANPTDFMKSSKYLYSHGQKSPYAEFYLQPVPLWNSIIKEGFKIHDRDKEVKFL